MVGFIRGSRVAGYSRHQITHPVGKRLTLPQTKKIRRHIFTEILPQDDIRKRRLELTGRIPETLTRGEKPLVEPDFAIDEDEHLIPLISVKLGRMNDGRNLSLYPEMQYADTPKLSVIVAANFTRQTAAQEYIRKLSRMLLTHELITAPPTCVLQRGREHYAYKCNVLHHLAFVTSVKMRRELERLLLPNSSIDLTVVSGLSPLLKNKMCVPVRCSDNCKHKGTCQFLTLPSSAITYPSNRGLWRAIQHA